MIQRAAEITVLCTAERCNNIGAEGRTGDRNNIAGRARCQAVYTGVTVLRKTVVTPKKKKLHLHVRAQL